MKSNERYIRLIELGWSLDILQNMRCLVVGAGAVGNEVIKNLALLGVRSIFIIDMDDIEDSNLTRSVLFRESDVGKSKAIVAAERAMEIDQNTRAVPIVGEFQRHLGAGAFYDFDVIFGCLDNTQARIDLTRNCMQANRLYIDAGLRGIDGDLKIFGNGYEVCFDCLLTRELRNEAWRRHSCLKLRTREGERPSGPTSPTISSIIAGLQVQFAVKNAHGMEIPYNHRISVHSHLNEFSIVRLARNRNCPTHYQYGIIEASKLIPLGFTTTTATCQDLYQAIAKDLGDGSTIDLEFDLIVDAYCERHDYRKPILKRRGTIYEDEMLCPECLAQGLQSMEALMSENAYNQITGNEPFLNQKISRIGIAPKSIIKAFKMKGDDVEFRYYVLQDRYLQL